MPNKRLLSDYLLIFFVLLAGMWPLLTGNAVMKWDIMDIYLPWKYFITEALKNAELPLWNPFINFGFAQQGDPGSWYPVSWLVGFVFPKYNITAVHFEYLLHLYIAGTAMYLLAKSKKFSRTTQLVLAVSYMFSGFFISNAQHLGWLVSAAWLPYVFYYFSVLRKEKNYLHALKFAFVLFLMLSGGYPGIFISMVYVLAGFYLAFVIAALKEKRYYELQAINRNLLISAFAFLIFSAVVLVASFDLKEHIIRGNGLQYDDNPWGILTGFFPAKALISLIYPFAVGYKDSSYWSVDFSMINTYFGVGLLMLLIFSNFRKNIPKELRVYTLLGGFFLLMAMPQIFLLRKCLLFLPFMDMFRFSALFRLYAIFFFLLASGYALDKILGDKTIRLKFYRFLLYAVSFFTMVNGILLFFVEKWKFKKIFTKNWLYFNNLADVDERVFFQGGIVIVLLASLAFFIKKGKTIKIGFKYLLFLVLILDMVISVQLNLYATVISGFPVKEINKSFQNLQSAYPQPSLKTKMSEVTDSKLVNSIPYLWKNMAVYQKIPSGDGVNPYRFVNSAKAEKNGSIDALINQPVLFLAKKINGKNVIDTNYIDEESYQKLEIIDFNNNSLKVRLSSDTVQYLVFLQNYYPYWQAKLNGEQQPVLKVNDTFMAVKLNEGVQEASFVFRPTKVIYAAYLSIASWLIFFSLLIISKIRNYTKRSDIVI